MNQCFEARDTLRLQLAGKIDQWFAKTDGSGAVFLMNVTDTAEADKLLEAVGSGHDDDVRPHSDWPSLAPRPSVSRAGEIAGGTCWIFSGKSEVGARFRGSSADFANPDQS
jgi:hypothetical protein